VCAPSNAATIALKPKNKGDLSVEKRRKRKDEQKIWEAWVQQYRLRTAGQVLSILDGTTKTTK
jgi:hypothetical protein